jgi:two-component system, LuxR family, sensor kinase FixL
MDWKRFSRIPAMRVAIISILLLVCTALLAYFHSVRRIDVIFTHFYYFPIILAAYWWGWGGMFAPLYLSIILLGSDIALPTDRLGADVVRAACFCINGAAAAFVSERLIRSRRNVIEQSRMLDGLRLIDQILIRSDSPREIAQSVCDVLVGASKIRQAWIILTDSDKRLTEAAWSGVEPSLPPKGTELASLTPTCLEHATDGVSELPPTHACENCWFAANRKGKYTLTARITHQGRLYGVICLNSTVHHGLGKMVGNLFHELANDIAYALHHLELEASREGVEEALRRSREDLERQVAKRTGELKKTTDRLRKEIGEHERTLERLGQNELVLSQVIQGIGAPVFVLDRNHRVMQWNREIEQLTGVSSEHILGTGNQWQPFYSSQRPVLADLVMEPDPSRLLERWYGQDAHRSEQAPDYYEMTGYFNMLGNRMKRWVEASAAPIRDSAGNIIGAVQIVQDITERRRTEETLRRSEQMFRSYFELPLIGIGMLSPKRRWLSVNDKLCTLLGYSRAELLRHPWSELTGSAEESGQLDYGAAPQGPVVRRMQLLCKEGKEITAQVSSDSVFKEDGALDYIVVLVEDITGLQQAEQQLRESEVRFRSLFEQAAEIIFIHDFDGVILEANRRTVEVTGFSHEELVGLPVSMLDSGFQQKDYAYAYREQAESGEGAGIETRYRMLESGDLPVEVRLKTLVYQNRRVVLVMARDITQRKRQEMKMTSLLSALEDKNRELSEFAHVVSHDLKAPLRAISSLTNWIANDYAALFDDSGRQQLNLLLDRTHRLHDLIDGILEYSRIGRTKERMQPVFLTELVGEVIQMLSPPLEVQIRIDNPLPTLICEKNRMLQVFQNLVGNAIRYMDKSEGQIHIGCREQRGFWRFYVQDNGCGIDPRYHEKVFQIFQTLKPREGSGSTGIGLTIVKRIIESYGGRIWIESESKQGATFFFIIPKRLRTEVKSE